MYKVYRDPEGEHCLDEQPYKSSRGNSIMNLQYSEEDYKERILSLNLEIKGLNEKLEKV